MSKEIKCIQVQFFIQIILSSKVC